MEVSDFVNRVEEDEDLRFFVYFLVEVFKDSSNYIFMHFRFIPQYFVIIFYSLQCYLCSSKFAMNQIIDVEFNHILCVLFVESQKLFLHCGWTSNNIRSVFLSNFENFSQCFFLLLEDIIDLINCNKFAVIKVEVTSLRSVHKWLGHGYNNVTVLMLLLVHSTDFEPKLFWFFVLSKLGILC